MTWRSPVRRRARARPERRDCRALVRLIDYRDVRIDTVGATRSTSCTPRGSEPSRRCVTARRRRHRLGGSRRSRCRRHARPPARRRARPFGRHAEQHLPCRRRLEAWRPQRLRPARPPNPRVAEGQPLRASRGSNSVILRDPTWTPTGSKQYWPRFDRRVADGLQRAATSSSRDDVTNVPNRSDNPSVTTTCAASRSRRAEVVVRHGNAKSVEVEHSVCRPLVFGRDAQQPGVPRTSRRWASSR